MQIARRYEISEDDPGGLLHSTICLRTDTATFCLNKSTRLGHHLSFKFELFTFPFWNIIPVWDSNKSTFIHASYPTLNPIRIRLMKTSQNSKKRLASQRIIINNKLSTKRKPCSANYFCFRHWCHEFPGVVGMLWPPSTDPDREARDGIIVAIDHPFCELKSRTPLGCSLDWINIHDL